MNLQWFTVILNGIFALVCFITLFMPENEEVITRIVSLLLTIFFISNIYFILN
jgi:uncharacterized membrane protein